MSARKAGCYLALQRRFLGVGVWSGWEGLWLGLCGMGGKHVSQQASSLKLLLNGHGNVK